MDETKIQVNKEEGKKASSQSWMWVMQSGMHEPSGAAIPQKLLETFTGYLTTDAYIGYEKVEGITRSLCWAPCRRYFVESIPLDSKGKEIAGSKGAEGREFINLLFKLEDEMKELSHEKRKEKRQEASRAILDAFWSWVEETSKTPTLYTLVETAKANKLDVYEYLHYLLTVMPNTDFKNNPELIDAYLPWADDLSKECRLTNTRKKCLQ